jgi:carboxypeptidase Q
LQAALLPIGANAFRRDDVMGTGDLSQLESGGVPVFSPLIDTSAYFNYHHTPADTLDKVDRLDLKRHVAVMTSLAWFLANTDQPLTRWVDAAK